MQFIPSGGLGNILFQHAAAYAFAKEHSMNIYTYIGNGQEHVNPERPNIQVYKTLFKHVNFKGSVMKMGIYKEPEFTYNEIPNDTMVIDGCFQSWKYFDKYRTEIRDLLTSNEQELFDRLKQKHQIISEGKKTTCVHIRRGDYLQYSDVHTIIDENYYKLALHNCKNKLIVFSDSIHMIKDWSLWNNHDVHFVEDEPDPLPTFFLMSMCDSFVIANSSLSLMAYYMSQNNDADLTAPAKWFESKGPKFNIWDIVPPSTNVIGEPIFFRFSCEKNKNIWNNSYFNGTTIPYVIVTGNPELTSEYEYIPETNRLILRCEDNYDGLPYKTHLGVKIINKLFNPSLIIKIDDCSIINCKNLESLIQRIVDEDIQYCGNVVKIDPLNQLSYTINSWERFENPKNRTIFKLKTDYCSGPLYVLGKRAIDVIIKYMRPEKIKYEDVNVGETLYHHEILPVNIENITSDSMKDYDSVVYVDK